MNQQRFIVVLIAIVHHLGNLLFHLRQRLVVGCVLVGGLLGRIGEQHAERLLNQPVYTQFGLVHRIRSGRFVDWHRIQARHLSHPAMDQQVKS